MFDRRVSKGFIAFFICLFALMCRGNALESSTSEIATTREVGPHGKCQIDGNGDLYGLGVRLGVYFQIVGSYLANNFIPDEISGQLDANSIFLISLLFAMVKYTMENNDTFRVIDALILVELSFGYFFSVLSLFGYRTVLSGRGSSNISTIGTHLRIFITAAISAYTVWFWFSGISSGLPSDCPTKVFFFVSENVDGGIKYFWRVSSIACALYYGSLSLAVLYSFLAWLASSSRVFISATRHSATERHHGLEFWEKTFLRSFSPRSREAFIGQKDARIAFHILRILNFAYIIWAILTVELTIVWNGVTGVTGSEGLATVGQQLPALIGAFSFVRSVWLICAEVYEDRLEKANAEISGNVNGNGHPRGPYHELNDSGQDQSTREHEQDEEHDQDRDRDVEDISSPSSRSREYQGISSRLSLQWIMGMFTERKRRSEANPAF